MKKPTLRGGTLNKSKRTGVVVTKRDDLLFHYLFVNKVATVVDIQKDIFNNIQLRVVHNRLKKLSNAGFIEAQSQREMRNRLVYFLTKLGFRKSIADDGVAKRIQLKSDSIEHDLTVLQIKRKFRQFENVLGFYSENLVRSGLMDDYPEMKELRELRPDAVVKLKVQDKIHFVPLEYEASVKSPRRNAKLLSKYYLNPFVPGVIFISKTDTIERKICQKELAKNSDYKGKFYYIQLEDVINAQEKLSLSNVKNGILSIT